MLICWRIIFTMFCYLILCAIGFAVGSCDDALDEESRGGECTELTCLFSELAHLRHSLMKLTQALDDEKRINEEQTTLIAKQEADIKKMRTEIAILKRQTPKETKNGDFTVSLIQTSRSHKVVQRAEDLGPLETAVTQIGQQLTALDAEVQALKNSDSQQGQIIQEARTSTFVHWGSSRCPSSDQLVYSGFVGGSSWDQTGGGTTVLCLTMSPVFGIHHTTINQFAYLYGSEYQTDDARHNLDVVCAVCRSNHATTIMIPGTNVCIQGWTKQYDGFLMAENYNENASDFICMDSVMEPRAGSEANQNGRTFFFTLTQCGSLPCAPYENNRLVTCVVCSR